MGSGSMRKVLAVLFCLFGAPVLAQNTPPGSSGQVTYNNGGLWGGAAVGTGLQLTGGTLSNTGVASYPTGTGLVQTTGSGWGTTITPGTGVTTALADAVNASGGFLTYGGIPYAALPTLSANQWLGALTATTPSGQNWPSCSATGNWLQYTSGTGVGCITSGYPLASISGFGSNVETALATAVGSAGGPVVNGGVLGTPSSGTATNLTGTATGLTAGIAQALASATTTVNTSSATAPTLGQVLRATSSTQSAWQTPTDGGGPALALFYNALSAIGSSVVRIENLGDSILTCNLSAPCTFGPARIGSTFPLMLIDELSQRFQQYSTGYRAIERLSNGSTTVSAGDGYTLTSGTATNSTLLGPQQSGVSLNGGSLFTFSNGAVLTIAVGQPYSSVNIMCVQGTGTSGYTVTINGSSVGTACGSGSGTNTATIQNFANPVAFASQPTTGSTLTLTALGATNYLYAYEGVLFCGASNTACTTGFTVDNFGVGGASSPWFASGTKAGTGSAGMVWVNALPGKVALCVLENGENDAQASSGPVTSTQQNAQNQAVATACQTLNASVLFWVPPPYNDGGSPAVYAGLQQGSLTYCQSQGWACLNMADLFMGDQSGTLSSAFPFTAQNTGMGLTPPWGVAQGMITNSDSQHLNDCGELLVTQQFMTKVFKVWPAFPITQACSMNPLSTGISSAYTNATASFTIIQGATANTGQLEFVAPVSQIFHTLCTGYMQVGTTGVVDFELVGSAAISVINMTLSYQTTATSVYTMVSATALSSALATSSITAASGLKWVLEINGVNSTTSNSFAVEAHEASGTLTIPAGATCTTQYSGPQ